MSGRAAKCRVLIKTPCRELNDQQYPLLFCSGSPLAQCTSRLAGNFFAEVGERLVRERT